MIFAFLALQFYVWIGCLANLSVVEANREEMSKFNDFYTMINSILDTYDFNPALIDYCIRLILNNSNTPLC